MSGEQWGASALMKNGDVIARSSARRSAWWFIGIGFLFASVTSFAPWPVRLIGWPLWLFYLSLGLYLVTVRLVVKEDRLTITTGPLRRSVNLSDLASIRYRRTGLLRRRSSARLILQDTQGKSIKIPIGGFGFDHDDKWGPTVLKAAERAQAAVEPKARDVLVHLDGTGRGYLV
jgi:hypothetical protein